MQNKCFDIFFLQQWYDAPNNKNDRLVLYAAQARKFPLQVKSGVRPWCAKQILYCLRIYARAVACGTRRRDSRLAPPRTNTPSLVERAGAHAGRGAPSLVELASSNNLVYNKKK